MTSTHSPTSNGKRSFSRLTGVSEILVQSAEGYQDLLDRLDYLELRETIRIGFQDIREGKSFPTFPALEELQKKLQQELGE